MDDDNIYNLLDDEFENYNFGDDVEVCGDDGWEEEGENHYVKIVYVEYPEMDDDSTSERVSLHVRLKDNGKVDETYALLHSNGCEIGYSENRNKDKKSKSKLK